MLILEISSEDQNIAEEFIKQSKAQRQNWYNKYGGGIGNTRSTKKDDENAKNNPFKRAQYSTEMKTDKVDQGSSSNTKTSEYFEENYIKTKKILPSLDNKNDTQIVENKDWDAIEKILKRYISKFKCFKL